jgi:hypothetical protein
MLGHSVRNVADAFSHFQRRGMFDSTSGDRLKYSYLTSTHLSRLSLSKEAAGYLCRGRSCNTISVRSSGQNLEFTDPCQMRTTWPRKQVLGREIPGDFTYVKFIFEYLLYPFLLIILRQ